MVLYGAVSEPYLWSKRSWCTCWSLYSYFTLMKYLKNLKHNTQKCQAHELHYRHCKYIFKLRFLMIIISAEMKMVLSPFKGKIYINCKKKKLNKQANNRNLRTTHRSSLWPCYSTVPWCASRTLLLKKIKLP